MARRTGMFDAVPRTRRDALRSRRPRKTVHEVTSSAFRLARRRASMSSVSVPMLSRTMNRGMCGPLISG